MNNCEHTTNQSIACKRCKIPLCVECAIDKSNRHSRHELVTFNQIIKTYMQEKTDKITNTEAKIAKQKSEIEYQQSEITRLANKRSDTKILLEFINSTTLQCQFHETNCEVICATCKMCICTKCMIARDNIHKNHDLKLFEEIVEYFRELDEKIILEAKLRIDCINTQLKQDQNYLEKLKIVTAETDIINKYLSNRSLDVAAPNTTNLTSISCKNQMFDLDFVQKHNLKTTLKYKLITTNGSHVLDPGYYMVIAVGGGGSGGLSYKTGSCSEYGSSLYYNTDTGGGGSGYVSAKILQIIKNTEMQIEIGFGGALPATHTTDCVTGSRVINTQHNYVSYSLKSNYLNGKPTKIKIDDLEIVADGGETAGLNGTETDYYYSLTKNECSYTDSYFYISTLYGGKGFSGGGHVGNFGGTNGKQCDFTVPKMIMNMGNYVINENKAGHMVNPKIVSNINEICNSPTVQNSSGSDTITAIQNIFPLVYPGSGGCFNEKKLPNAHIGCQGCDGNGNYGCGCGCRSKVGRIILPFGCGAGGLCLTNYNNYLSNGKALNTYDQAISSQGFGAGGYGSLHYSEHLPYITWNSTGEREHVFIKNGTSGFDGCVIIVYLD